MGSPPVDYRREPTYWFVLLDRAVERGDLSRAAEAQAELRKLGVEVKYRPRTKQGAAS